MNAPRPGVRTVPGPSGTELARGISRVAIAGRPGRLGLLKDGDRVIFAAKVQNGKLAPSVCMSHARFGTEAGAALMADAEAVFGPGEPLGGPTAGAGPAADAPVETSVTLLVIVGFPAIAVLLLFAAITVVARGRQKGSPR